MIATLAVMTGTVYGVMVGVEFSVAVFTNPGLRRLPAGASLQAFADGARVGGRVMPFWYIGSLLLVAWLAAAKWGGLAGDAAVAALIEAFAVWEGQRLGRADRPFAIRFRPVADRPARQARVG